VIKEKSVKYAGLRKNKKLILCIDFLNKICYTNNETKKFLKKNIYNKELS